MQVQINTDRNIAGDETLTDRLADIVRGTLDRFGERVTRVEVYLSDQSSDKKGGGDDLRCVIEARVAGLQPAAVTHDAASLEDAVDGAAGKMKRQLESTLGRLNEH